MNFLNVLRTIGAGLKVAIGIETEVIPIFVHNPKTQTIAAVVLTFETELADVLTALGANPGGPTPSPASK